MAKLAIMGLLSLALLALKVSASAEPGLDPTRVDDSDYEPSGFSGLQPDRVGVWIEPVIPPDPNWRSAICHRYRNSKTYKCAYKHVHVVRYTKSCMND